MKDFVNRYAAWSDMKKNMFLLLMIAVAGTLISIPFIFLENVGVLLGWLLGSAVNFVAYVSIAKFSAAVLSQNQSKFGYFAMVGGFLRFLLYAGALVLAGFASFRWGTLAHGYCNLISCALALMPTWILLVCTTLFRNAKSAKKPVEEKKTENPEEEA